MKINEIYYSIQGESTFAGLPCIFIRTTFCNLRCSYCDTKHAYYEGSDYRIDEILKEVQKYPTQLLEITGGEPLLQADINDLATALLDQDYTVLCETSGSLNIDRIDRRVHRIVDFKTPDSGESEKNDWTNISRLTEKDELKFVICSRRDYDWAKGILEAYDLYHKQTILFSPEFERQSNEALAEWIIEDGLPVRFQIQLHKYVWNPERQGV